MTDIEAQRVTLVRKVFSLRETGLLRRLVAWAARRVGLDRERGQDLALAVTEAAGNAITHGGGQGRLDLIQDGNRALIVEISDDGPGIAAEPPTALPPAEQGDGRGLFLMRQTCDRVDLSTGPGGTTVRLEVDITPNPVEPPAAG